jgi:hypothetical protein
MQFITPIARAQRALGTNVDYVFVIPHGVVSFSGKQNGVEWAVLRISQTVFIRWRRSVEVVRNSFGFRNKKRKYAFGFHRDHIVLILQDAFDGQKPF